MTALAGLKHRGRVYLAADSAIVVSDNHMRGHHTKVYRNGELVIAGCGGLADLQSVQRMKAPPVTDDASDYLAGTFASAIRSVLGIARGKSWECSLLIGARGRLFQLDEYFSVVEFTSFAADGQGSEYVLGSLFGTRGLKMPPAIRLRRAVGAACAYSAGCGGTITVVGER